ncbi:MAG TPA: SIMPL domain-containing protein [Candidatus Rubrimentiphilum sp.]|nr:SIMPL domain-containing protein [Candidatus Rubrimentiphilum sp.]
MRYLAIALFVSIALGTHAVAADVPPTSINASGQATVSAPPDIAIINLTITTHNAIAEEATSANNAIYAHFTTGMRTIGIAESDIKTTGYNLYYNPGPPPCPLVNSSYPQPPCVRDLRNVGYSVTRSITITVHRLDLVGKTIDTAVDAGVNNVGGVSYGISNTKALFLRALADAVASARSQAEVLAQAAGLHIIRVASISTGYSPPPPMIAGALKSADVYGAPTVIPPPGTLDVQASVNATFLATP